MGLFTGLVLRPRYHFYQVDKKICPPLTIFHSLPERILDFDLVHEQQLGMLRDNDWIELGIGLDVRVTIPNRPFLA